MGTATERRNGSIGEQARGGGAGKEGPLSSADMDASRRREHNAWKCRRLHATRYSELIDHAWGRAAWQ
jgi:hypothetical protein